MARAWLASRATRRDYEAGKALQDLGLVRRQSTAMRVARMLRLFLRENPALIQDPAAAWLSFVGQLINEKKNGQPVRSWSTVLQYVNVADKYGIKPQNLGEAEQRLVAAAIKGGLAAKKKEEKKEVRYHQIAAGVSCWPIREPEGKHVYQTGLYLVLATGCRAEHLCRIRRAVVTAKGVHILWGDRKIRERRSTDLLYEFKWSARPPINVAAWIEAWPRVHAILTHSDGGEYVAARRLNSFIDQRLGRHVRGLSTSYYRRRMSTLLLHEVAAGRMTGERFSDLMDHTLGTGGSRYRLEGEAAGLKMTINFFA